MEREKKIPSYFFIITKYNILFKVQTEDNYLLFNTMSNSVLKLDSDNAKILMDYVTNAYL